MHAQINRYAWMAIFFIGILVFTWLGWGAERASPIIWFIVSGVWSAVCGIGFSATNSLFRGKPDTFVKGNRTED